MEASHRLCKPYRVRNRKDFRLRDFDPGDIGELKYADKALAKDALQNGIDMLAELQDEPYGQDRWSVLLIFQAMDAAGKDGKIRHVTSGINPQGCQVPADNKWFTRVIVAAAVIDALVSLKLSYPEISGAKRREFEEAREALMKGK